MDTDAEKFDAALSLLDRAPELIDVYITLFIQQRNIRSGANTMDAQSGLTLIGEPGAGLLGLHRSGTQYTDKNGNFTNTTAGEGRPSNGDSSAPYSG